MTSSPFDAIASSYDAIWTRSPVGRLQRDVVWRWLDPLIRTGNRILDLGCGTGEDAQHLMKLGAEVCGIDASAEMVRIARRRGVDARQLPLEDLSDLRGSYHGAISNFGVLNCARDLHPVSMALSKLIRPGGFLALCVMGSLCAWETLHFISRRNPRAAVRRFRRGGMSSSLGVHVTYPSVSELKTAFHPAFQLTRWIGVGLCVPPSYVSGLSDAAIQRLARMDRLIAHWPVLRSLADHRLLLFTRT